MSITITQGSILDFEGDAIVNPANSFLRHGGGLAKVIADAARTRPPYPPDAPVGQRRALNEDYLARSLRFAAEQRDHPNIPTGGCGVTSAGALPYKGIIHAVGPIWGGGDYYEGRLLAKAHDSALRAAVERGWTRIAFPALSCGIFGYPVAQAAHIAVDEVVYFIEGDLDVTFYLFEDSHYEAYWAAYRATR